MRRRSALRIGLVLLVLLTVLAGTALLTLRSQWFYEKVRLRIIDTVETATGGRVEIGRFRFHWQQLRAEVAPFTLHGRETADKPPLFRAAHIAIGLKIVSLWKRDIDIQYLDVIEPRVYLIVLPDGRTNVPEPRIKSRDRNTVETILNLAIGRFSLQNGIVEVEKRGAAPFHAQGQNLAARFVYEAAGPRYRGEVSIQPLEVHWPQYAPVPFGVNVAVAVEKNRIAVTSARAATGESQLEVSGAIEDLAAPHGRFQYDARVSLGDLSRILRIQQLERGTAQIGGTAEWRGGEDYSATGNLRAYGVDYRDSAIRLRGCSLEGAVSARSNGIEVEAARVFGTYVASRGRLPVSGRIGRIALHGRDLDLDRLRFAALGGEFHGDARVRGFDRYSVTGEAVGFEARPAVALYSQAPLPWNAKGWGPVRVEGSLRNKRELSVTARMTVGPAPDSAPVHGTVQAVYEARGATLDLGRSTLELPASRAEFSGVFGRELRVRLETHDLNDILPAIGESAERVPVKLENGSAVFAGTVTGALDNPVAAGRLEVHGLAYADRRVDSLTGGVLAMPDRVAIDRGEVKRGALAAQFAFQMSLENWKAEQTSSIFGSGSIRNAPVAEVLDLLGLKEELTAGGQLSAEAGVRGTVEHPIAHATVEVAGGSFEGEPFDRLQATLDLDPGAIRLTSGLLTAGRNRATLSASLEHPVGQFDRGRLRFQLGSNDMSLEEIQTLQEQRPGVKGTVRAAASGEIDLAPGATARERYRLADLRAEISGRGLQLAGQQLGDLRVAARSEGQLLRTHLDANLANSAVVGDGEWRLEGDYPGRSSITFSKLDLAQLRPWISPEEADRIAGSAEGQLNIQGPLLRWEEMKAELRLPRLEIGPAPSSGVPASLALRNSGPVAATLSNSVITIESARLVGRGTDMSITGKVSLQSGNLLDLRLNGKLDLATVQDFDEDLTATGTVTAEGTVRGSLEKPLLNGRMQFENAAFSLVDFPNGISRASGVIQFTGERATIQKLTGETGGGTIDLSGFASYSGGTPVFRIYAEAHQVRVRYPEGVSTVADARLSLTGTIDRSTLAGTITVLRTGFNPQSDFSSLIAKSAEPVQTPAVRTGLLGGMNFDVQITTSPDIEFESSLTQDLQAEANLKLRGTPTNPAIIGRINITHGQVIFYGTKYNINQGSIAFYNALKVEPILDIDLETKARGIDVTLTVTGPLNKLNLTPRSDPPLQFNEIVGLLATGRTPTSDPTMLTREATAPQSWQQMGASALLGQAIASPVAGRLQRFFGVSKLRIDPTLPGVENNPQARLTLEQQVTQDITFTYITNVTSSNPQVVRVEWAFSRQWSVVAIREENGVFGLDFFYKRRF